MRKIYYFLSPSLRLFIRRAYFLPRDVYDYLFRRRKPLVPPKGLIFIGQGDFEGIGDNFLQNFKQFCNLKPSDKLLDIGCGIGRIARPLAGYLDSCGEYYGFDIVKKGIDWCNKAYKEYKNFHFLHIPLKNDLYNLSTQRQARDFVFPYKSDFFNLVVLTSVFTHMQVNEVRHYIAEISRVLQSGGYCFCTFFMITRKSDNYLLNSKTPFFKYRHEEYFLHDNKVNDANIAYKYEVIEKMLGDCDLRIASFYPGWWSGKDKSACLSYQDVLIISK